MTDVLQAPGEAIESVVTVPSVFGDLTPIQTLREAWKVAQTAVDIIERHQLYATIRGKKYLEVEAWQMIGASVGVFAEIQWTRRMKDEVDADGVIISRAGWEAASVATHLASGKSVGRAESQCARDERTWSDREDYALRGMAQTRATSRALRGPLQFIVRLAGYESTASEEMPRDEG